MKTTTNLGLKKPEAEDFYSVDDMNYNSDKIDEKIGEIGNIKESTYTKQEVDTKVTELENSIDTDIEILETQLSNAVATCAKGAGLELGVTDNGILTITYDDGTEG